MGVMEKIKKEINRIRRKYVDESEQVLSSEVVDDLDDLLSKIDN